MMQSSNHSSNQSSIHSRSTAATAEVQKKNANGSAVSLGSGTAVLDHPPSPMRPISSMATTISASGSTSGRSSSEEADNSNNTGHLGLPLDSTSDEGSHSGDDIDISLEEDDDLFICPPVQVKEQHCVDCGDCTCDCFMDDPNENDDDDDQTVTTEATAAEAPTTTAAVVKVKSPSQRAYSIKLGRAQDKMLEEMFGSKEETKARQQQRQQHLSSRALTVVGNLSTTSFSSPSNSSMAAGTPDSNSSSNKDFFVRRLAFDGDEEKSQHLEQHKDNTDNPHLPDNSHKSMGCSGKWSNWINVIRIYTCRFLRWITHYAATYPKSCVGIVIFNSIAFLTVGLLTNFNIEVENGYLWPPQDSLSRQHTNWYYYNSEFNYDTSFFDMIIHADGKNVIGQEGVRRTFEAITALAQLEGYAEGCFWASMFGDEYYVGECKIHSVADFWNESLAIFEEQVDSDQDVRAAMSAVAYPDGIIVDEPRILGKPERASYYGSDDDVYTQLDSAESYLIEFDLPWTNVTEDFELLCLERIQLLQDEWDQDPDNIYKIEMSAYRSYSDEFFRAIVKDIPLLPCVFTIMSAFCCFVFWKKNRVHSRCLLGVGAVVCILLSILTGYGLLFIFGVSFTPVTTMMPFLMFGIGLDDAFILYGSYNRTDPRKDPVKRIEETIDDVGLSISLTTLTSTVAFFSGVFSGIPAVSWVCWYAWPTIVIDFIYQITFFIALIVLDEQRIAANRRDICIWQIAPLFEDDEDLPLPQGSTFSESDDSEGIRSPAGSPAKATKDISKAEGEMQPMPTLNDNQRARTGNMLEDDKAHFADRFMRWFSKQILKPKVQGVVVTAFLVIFGSMLYCATQLSQQFDYIDMVPKDSYLREYYSAVDDFSVRTGLYTYVFFRDIDQSDSNIQDQMEAYLDDLTDSSAIAHQPTYFWLRDFKGFVASNENTLGNMTFNEQIGEFFKDPSWKDLYGEHVVVSKEDGHIIESRCIAYVDVDMRDTNSGTAMLHQMREVSGRQPINLERGDWAFLTYADEYHILEFYNVVVKELIFTTITGVITVSVIGMIFIPHWTAVLFVFPFITFLYIDMLGFLYLSGVQINAISYITLVMSIGLMVDFIMHILLRYYEANGTREQRVVETLTTMGASILVGAISTFLGVMLLVFSTSAMINNIFVAFIGLVIFGVLHGLVFLPTLLAMVGPE